MRRLKRKVKNNLGDASQPRHILNTFFHLNPLGSACQVTILQRDLLSSKQADPLNKAWECFMHPTSSYLITHSLKGKTQTRADAHFPVWWLCTLSASFPLQVPIPTSVLLPLSTLLYYLPLHLLFFPYLSFSLLLNGQGFLNKI